MGDWKVVNEAFGALPKILSAGAIALALAYFLWTGNFRNAKVLSRFSILFSSFIIGIIFCSILIWIVDLQSLDFIIKGVSKISYQLLNIAIIIAAVYMFEEDAAKYTFFGLVAANIVIILLAAVSNGFGRAVQDLIRNITSFGANDVINNSQFIHSIEIHDITFAMGVYVLYFLFFCPTEKNRYWYAFAALFLFFAGLKRIAFLSLLVGFLFGCICMCLGPKRQRLLVRITSIFIVLFCCYYVVIIHDGLFTRFLSEHDIELNGRERIYDFISRYYEISPLYGGKGYEFCVHLLKSMRETKEAVVNINAVHNDILKMYVEMGFWGFLFWIVGYYVFQANWYVTRCGEKVAVCFMTISVYMLITYMTDNTLFYYWSSMVIRMIPMAFFYAPVKEVPLKQTNILRMTEFEKWLYRRRRRAEKEKIKPRMKLQAH